MLPYLVSTSLGDSTKVRDVDGLAQARFVRRIEDGIERDVLQDLVKAEFVRIEDHGGLWVTS